MTTPHERYRTLIMVSSFLYDLTDKKETKRIPKEIRNKASRLLRHYVWPVEVDELAKLDVTKRILDKRDPLD